MNKMVLVGLLLMISMASQAKRLDNIHFPILGSGATSLAPGEVSLESYPGSNGTSHFISNALMVGLTDNFDIGTIPLFQSLGKEFESIAAKYQIYGTPNIQVSIGGTYIGFSNTSISETDSSRISGKVQNTWMAVSGQINYTPQAKLYNVSFIVNNHLNESSGRFRGQFNSFTTTKSGNIKPERKIYKGKLDRVNSNTVDLIIEGNYYLANKLWLGASIGSVKRDSLINGDETIYPNSQISLGTNLAYQGSFLNLKYPSIGITHFKKEGINSISFSGKF